MTRLAPIPHSPPIAKPNAARIASNAPSDGARPDATEKAENARITTISTGRRP